MMTSGAWRRAFFRPICKLAVSLPTSRWFTMDFLLVNMYSSGSSMVRMWPVMFSLRWSSMAASVVDLPAPVAPTMRMRPRFSSTRVRSTSGRLSVCSGGMSGLMKRMTAEYMPRWRMAERRKLPTPCSGMAVLSSPVSFSSSMRLGGTMSSSRFIGPSTGSGCELMGRYSPLILMVAGARGER